MLRCVGNDVYEKSHFENDMMVAVSSETSIPTYEVQADTNSKVTVRILSLYRCTVRVSSGTEMSDSGFVNLLDPPDINLDMYSNRVPMLPCTSVTNYYSF